MTEMITKILTSVLKLFLVFKAGEESAKKDYEIEEKQKENKRKELENEKLQKEIEIDKKYSTYDTDSIYNEWLSEFKDN